MNITIKLTFKKVVLIILIITSLFAIAYYDGKDKQQREYEAIRTKAIEAISDFTSCSEDLIDDKLSLSFEDYTQKYRFARYKCSDWNHKFAELVNLGWLSPVDENTYSLGSSIDEIYFAIMHKVIIQDNTDKSDKELLEMIELLNEYVTAIK